MVGLHSADDVLLALPLVTLPRPPCPPCIPPAPSRSGGFFEGDDDFCQALVDGGCVKALQLQLCRDVEGAQFVEALEEALAPRMRLMGGALPCGLRCAAMRCAELLEEALAPRMRLMGGALRCAAGWLAAGGAGAPACGSVHLCRTWIKPNCPQPPCADTKSLDAFKSFFLDKKLAKDTNVVLMYRTGAWAVGRMHP